MIASTFVFSTNNAKCLYADEPDTNKTNVMNELDVKEGIEMISDELSRKGTSISSALQNQLSFYQNMCVNIQETEQIEKIEELIDATQEIVLDYENYQRSSERGSFHLIYSAAVAAVIAYFNNSGYNFAAELLTHARDNNDLDSIYEPVNKDDVLSSTVYQNIRYGSTLEGSSSFPESGATNDKDLYYAIHSFYYTKSESGRTIEIQDRYDYEPGGYGSIGQVAVSMMYSAQQEGVIVPYYSVITHNFDGTPLNQTETYNMSNSERYFEDKITLGQGEYKDYYFTFGQAGTKIIQTLGSKDAYLRVYDSNGNLIDENDDDGYGRNALIRKYCYANTQYKIRVDFWSSTKSGEIKLIVVPAFGAIQNGSTNIDSYEDILNISHNNNNCYAYALNNQVYPGTNSIWYKQQPGEYAGATCTIYDKQHLVAAVQADFQKYNSDFGTHLTFEEVGRFEECPKGTYKVALVSYFDDYHWYRQDSDGFWSHKPGTTPVRLLDSSFNPIFDPYLADISPYVNFLGFFAVTPWSNIYEA